MGACIFLSKAQRFNAKLLFLLHGGKKDNPTFVPTGVWPDKGYKWQGRETKTLRSNLKDMGICLKLVWK